MNEEAENLAQKAKANTLANRASTSIRRAYDETVKKSIRLADRENRRL